MTIDEPILISCCLIPMGHLSSFFLAKLFTKPKSLTAAGFQLYSSVFMASMYHVVSIQKVQSLELRGRRNICATVAHPLSIEKLDRFQNKQI